MRTPSIVPFVDAEAKREAEKEAKAESERKRVASENPIGAIEDMLRAFEGMDNQISRLIEIVDDLQRRVVKLERVRDSKIMQVERISRGNGET